ncbi:DUF1992 domain-containing protein [Arthrobacter sp. ISL-30]|nr:DUF1992 domain-containing protein [Arthrobacter sp. ISL-30]MBT2515356.1 DUF1992 domain-containing protein [Arthrobacter sp. ISL-30]
MGGRAAEEFERRLARAAELRAAGTSGGSKSEDPAAQGMLDELNEKRRKISHAARADYLIRDAMARGEFENLKYAGKPIPGLGEGHDPDWWVKGLIQRENLTGLGPKAILLRTEDAELDDRLDTHYSEKQVREILEDFNARVIDARRQLQGGPPVVTKTRDVELEVRRWQERRAAAASSAPTETEPDPKRPWWRRIWSGPW